MNWYYSIDGRANGPVSDERLANLAKSGTVVAETLIWHPGLEEWEPASKLQPSILAKPAKRLITLQASGGGVNISAPKAEEPPARKGLLGRLFGKLRGE